MPRASTPPRRRKSAAPPVTAADILRALAADPEAAPASRQWAVKLLRGGDGKQETEKTNKK